MSTARTVDQYLAKLPPARRATLSRVRDFINAKMPRGYEERLIGRSMIAWCVADPPPWRLDDQIPLLLAYLTTMRHRFNVFVMAANGGGIWYPAETFDDLPLDEIGKTISRFSVDKLVAAYGKKPTDTVEHHLASLPADRRAAMSLVRDAINARLPRGYEERIQADMIAWCVPESVLPAKQVHNKQPLCLAGVAVRERHMSLYLLGVSSDDQLRGWFEDAYKKSGKKLTNGASCVRFKSVDALPLDVIGEAIAKVGVHEYVASYRSRHEKR